MIKRKLGRYSKKQKRNIKVVKCILYLVIIAIMFLGIRELNPKICYGDFEGDLQAKCYNLK